MAAGRKKLTKEQVAGRLMKAAGFVALDAVPDCQSLYEAAEVIAQLIVENCPIARVDEFVATLLELRAAKRRKEQQPVKPMRPAKKAPVRKSKPSDK